MQFQTLLIAVLLVTNTQCLVRIRRMESVEFLDNFTECKKRLGVSDEIMKTTEDYWQDEKLKCLLACMFEKDGLWNADQTFNIDQFMKEFSEDTELESKKTATIKRICFEEGEIHVDKCIFANTFFKCCMETYENYVKKERKESKKAFVYE